MDAARDPRALCDDDREPGDEYPAREHGATGTARHVQDGHEATDRGDGGGAAHERVGLDEHRDPEQHRDHGEERPRHDPKGASAVPEVSARELGRGEPLEDRLRSHPASSDV